MRAKGEKKKGDRGLTCALVAHGFASENESWVVVNRPRIASRGNARLSADAASLSAGEEFHV